MDKTYKLISELVEQLREALDENKELKERVQELELQKEERKFTPRVISGGLSQEEDTTTTTKLSPKELELWVKNNIS
jgi:hypothetical protein|tara:strand:- start:227 stop:457 length:231 start_codon:yes stop_codon:yes gene_type:complete